MEAIPTDRQTEHIILVNDNQFFYSINPVEITNALGSVIATLLEYSIFDSNTQNYKLYKTKEGNWYDVRETNTTADKAIIMALKLAINSQENRELV